MGFRVKFCTLQFINKTFFLIKIVSCNFCERKDYIKGLIDILFGDGTYTVDFVDIFIDGASFSLNSTVVFQIVNDILGRRNMVSTGNFLCFRRTLRFDVAAEKSEA